MKSKKDKLTPERIRSLDALGFVWDPLEEQWEQGFKELSTYKMEHGHCSTSAKHITVSNYKLGRWVGTQRTRKDKLTPEKFQSLDALGFVWNLHAEQWEQGFKELSSYKEKHGGCLLSTKHITTSGHTLGRWVNKQRTRKDKLTPEQIQRLDALGFFWDPFA